MRNSSSGSAHCAGGVEKDGREQNRGEREISRPLPQPEGQRSQTQHGQTSLHSWSSEKTAVLQGRDQARGLCVSAPLPEERVFLLVNTQGYIS